MSRPLRKDAAERRTALLAAAAEVFAEEGLDAPLETVADRAGVGRATLYRNFPDRTALALAVLLAEVDQLGARTREQGDGPEVFFWFLDELAQVVIRNAAMAGVLRGVRSIDALTPLRRKMAEAGAEPLARAQAAGLVRDDIGPADIRILAALLGAGFHGADEAERRAVSRRTRALVLDGLRARP